MFHQLILFGLLGLVSASGWFNEYFWWLGERQVCYDGYGCFSTDHPFSNTEGHLPESPEYLDVKILLYTRQNRRQAIDVTKNVGETFDPHKDTKIIIHGYFNTIEERWVPEMKDAFLEKGDFNVIILNWERAAGRLVYLQSVANSRLVAAITAKFIKDLQKVHNIDASTIHIIGFSLGAHLAGYVGNAVDGLGRITGLDPAGPQFEGLHIAVRLDPSDASFVDVIHTDADKLFNADMSPGFGTKQAMGHADFYVNGGSDQPGCANNMNQHLLQILRGNFNYRQNFGCSHMRSLHIFTESINSNCTFRSYPCALENLQPEICSTCGESGCNNMGYNAINTSYGTYLTMTRAARPFCIS
ncbi:Inactive pancreatic lipase-related protein 1 [Mytilus edulis]|uniref:Inactive pancreatic lipase-related protein 1 n=1 Tax=Mytilus edulis TaxID=6550 RepID=A0A8S3TMS2_MYTED|nr:Inactive pancreatic lipase-related protein 1 [Mytilus edulis]